MGPLLLFERERVLLSPLVLSGLRKEEMLSSKTHALRFIALATIAVAIGPIYFYEVQLINVLKVADNDALLPSSEARPKNTAPPRLVLHVGLPKTATSAIQCRLNDMERRDALSQKMSAKIVEIESCRTEPFMFRVQMSKYFEQFPFELNALKNKSDTETSNKYTTYDRVIKGSSVLQHCLDVWINHYDRIAIPDCWSKSYQRYINTYHQAGSSIFVISNENLALPPFGKVPDLTACGIIFDSMLESLGKNSEIDIILTQRLHFDRMISMFGQEYDGDKFYSRPKLKRWTSDGGSTVPYLEKYIDNFPVDQLAQAIKCFQYASKNPRISFQVIDFHSKQPGVVVSFMEKLTRNATLTQQLADENHIVGTENVATERDNRIQFDRIAIAAKKAGIVPDSKERHEVRNDVSKYFEDNGLKIATDAKLKCPPAKFYDRLVNDTILIHQLAFPDEPVHAVRNRLRMFDFQPFRDIFCEVDGDATVQDEVMRSFIDQYKTLT